MSAAMHEMDADRYREQAHELARDGVAHLARAVNLLSSPETAFRYTQDVHEKMFSLGVEMARLIESGSIEPNPLHVQHLQFKAARADGSVQRVLQKAVRSAVGRGRRKVERRP